MDDSAALAVGAPVRLNGIIIGNVTQGETVGRERAAPDRAHRHVRGCRGSERASRWIRKPTISAENVLGTKYINIKKGKSPQSHAERRRGAEQGCQRVRRSGAVGLRRDGRGACPAEADRRRGQRDRGRQGHYRQAAGRQDAVRPPELPPSRRLQKVAAAVSSGQGTVGRLLYDDTLYNEVRTTVQPPG